MDGERPQVGADKSKCQFYATVDNNDQQHAADGMTPVPEKYHFARGRYAEFLSAIWVSVCRVFCGDLGNEVTDEVLASAFRKYKSFDKARVVRDKRTGKTKGYGAQGFCFGGSVAFSYEGAAARGNSFTEFVMLILRVRGIIC